MQYMAAMGVAMYVPRFVLPGARTSVQAPLPYSDAPKPEAEGLSHSVKQDDALEHNKGAAPVSGLLEGWLDKPSMPPRERALGLSPAAESKAQAPEEAVAFTLNLWGVSPHWMVLDTHRPKAALPTVTLLQNMLTVMGVNPSLPSADTLVWPMFKGHIQQGGWQAAREMVGAFLQSRLERHPVKGLSARILRSF